MSKRCKYCNKKMDLEKTKEYCSEYCQNKEEAFLNYFQKTKWIFYISVLISVVVLFVAAFNEKQRDLISWGMGLLGVAIFFFPFATPETVEIYGLRNTIRIVRVLAVIIVGLGITLAVV